MMKKSRITNAFLLTLAVVLVGCSTDPVSVPKEVVEPPVEDPLVQTYDNPEVGISFEYPLDVLFLEEGEYPIDPDEVYVSVRLKDMGTEEGPMSLSPEDEMKNVEALTSGEFGILQDFALPVSLNVKSVGFLFAQDFMVLSRFEVCNVTLERKLLFYFNNKEITITVHGPVDTLKESMSEYFAVNAENCGEEPVWDLEKQNVFYEVLLEGEAPADIQEWFGILDQISEAVIFAHR